MPALSPAEAMTLLCRAWPRWRRKSPRILEEALFYNAIAELGAELMDAAIAGKSDAVERALQAVERCLIEGDAEARNLVVVGMFEAMQNIAHARLEPPDALDRWLGPVSREKWADLIEGWTGAGIRTIAHWRRVVVNGAITRLCWTDPDDTWTLERLEDGLQLERRSVAHCSTRRLTAAEGAAILARFSPLIAERSLAPEATPLAYATLTVEQPHQSTSIRIGERRDPGRVASDGHRWFVLDADALAAALRGA
jgi:hypothetical protein